MTRLLPSHRSPAPRFCLLALLAAALPWLTGCATSARPAPTTVAYVDLDRYAGRWYVISHVPYFLERGKVASYDTYARRPDGLLTNDFTFREQTVDGPEKTWRGVARVVDTTTNATWQVSFLRPIWVTYKILALDPDYTWAVVATKDAGLMWVLARERQLPAATYAAILDELRGRGIAVDELRLVPQPAD